jgi:hypothetical protein
VVRHDNAYGVDIGMDQQFRVITVNVRNVEAGRELVAAVVVESGECYHLGSRFLGVTFQVKNAGTAADDPDVELIFRWHG